MLTGGDSALAPGFPIAGFGGVGSGARRGGIWGNAHTQRLAQCVIPVGAFLATG